MRVFAFILIAIAEMGAFAYQQSQIIKQDDYRAVAQAIKKRYQKDDALWVVPAWIRPQLYRHLGNLLTPRNAARDSLSGAQTLWLVRARDEAISLPKEAKRRIHQQRINGMVFEGWQIEAPRLVFDFAEHVEEASVFVGGHSDAQNCELKELPVRGGGLGFGPLAPAKRFDCQTQNVQLWVGTTVLEDLDLEPRYCIFQGTKRDFPLSTVFQDVPPAQRLILETGLYYEDERPLSKAPYVLKVWLGERLLGTFSHRDGEGWKRWVLTLKQIIEPPQSSHIRFEIVSESPTPRTMCWRAVLERNHEYARDL